MTTVRNQAASSTRGAPARQDADEIAFVPRIAIKETSGAIVLTVDLPGVAADEVDISLTGDVLTIRGCRRAELVGPEERVHALERPFGGFRRQLVLPAGLDADRISATLDAGVLRVQLPKAREVKARRVSLRGGRRIEAGGERRRTEPAAGGEAHDREAVRTLNRLLRLDVDAVRAYSQAIDACDVASIRTKLEEFRGDHDRHIEELCEAVRSLGGEPDARRDVKGFFLEAFTSIMSRGDHGALLAMRGDEQITNRSYESALGADLPGPARSLVEQGFDDEKRHLAWIREALAQRIWEQGEKRGRAA